ncbi:hypothetical protein NP233_g1830 [Leucocoprinus birnbaumii]|uniref:Ubiquitin 3 binding protein But2 C-terminal domain-containing protein n=1 Tax=Leucocoprinus birnbaumii TaxID=56174 RepID=A0AAD5YZF0_9AGAR|nr:hypothetical protein NP233_g1830 [Leucocoprinus birnbaumii]
MRDPSYEEYSLLPKDESSAGDLDGGYREPRSTSIWRATKWAIIICTLLILVDIAIYLRIRHILFSTDLHPDELPIQNPYIGLDELYSLTDVKPSKFDPLINVPILATQISRAEPDKAFPVDTHQWLSDYGTLSPPDRNLHVTNTINTIVQFHILDWGMEKCAITVRLPARDAVLPHEYELKDTRGTIRLDICELEATRPLNSLDLTWKKHPKCFEHVGTIDARVGEEVKLEPFFDCQSGTFRAFEISCSPEMPDCGVNVWSNHNDTWGLYITQYQTV